MKIHIAVNIKSKKIISIKVTDEHVHNGSKVLPKLVESIAKSKNDITLAGKVFVADGAYDSNVVFECLWRTMGFCLVI